MFACVRSVAVVGLTMAPAVWSSAWALDPGTYTVQCASAESRTADRPEYNIKMDKIDLLTLEKSFGAIIAGTRQDDGRRIILTGDHGCALIEARNASRR